MRRVLFLSLSLGLLACDAAGDGTADTLEGRLVVQPVDQLQIGGDVGPPVPTLLIQTERIYPCVNIPLDLDVRQSDGSISITVLGAIDQELCLTALGPATARVPLEVPNGVHRLRIVHDGKTDLYDLTLADDRIRLDSVATSVTRVPEALAWRRPPHSFAYACGTYTGDEALCEDFRARLEAAVPLERIEAPSEGVWPYSLQAGGYYYNPPSIFYQARSDADFETAKETLRQFSVEVLRDYRGDGLSLSAWDGDFGYSWIYERP